MTTAEIRISGKRPPNTHGIMHLYIEGQAKPIYIWTPEEIDWLCGHAVHRLDHAYDAYLRDLSCPESIENPELREAVRVCQKERAEKVPHEKRTWLLLSPRKIRYSAWAGTLVLVSNRARIEELLQLAAA